MLSTQLLLLTLLRGPVGKRWWEWTELPECPARLPQPKKTCGNPTLALKNASPPCSHHSKRLYFFNVLSN